MYAVVKTGGKQYKVTENDLLRIEKIEAEAGSIITLNEVLLVANDNDITVGSPLIDGAAVAVEILSQRRARKIIIFKKRRRKSSRTKNGHRQHFTLVRISEILTGGAVPTKPAQGMPEKANLTIVNDDTYQEEVPEIIEAKPVKKASKKAAALTDAIDMVDKIDATEAKPVKKASKKAKTEATDSTETSND
jgi:large subunit ribosomal protein L21